MSVRDFLISNGLPGRDLGELPDSPKRFPDGAAYRVEIPSTEGPRCFEAILAEADRLEVRVHRVSQGTGVALLTDDELAEFASLGAERRVEVSLFARPNAGWGASASARAPAGGSLVPAAWGVEQVVAQLEEIRRAADFGIRSVLIADIGVLRLFSAMRAAGELPADMQAKISVMLPAANPASARVLEDWGRARSTSPSTSRSPSSRRSAPRSTSRSTSTSSRPTTSAASCASTRSPRSCGCARRPHHFGLRNAPDLYPSGSHLEATAIALSRERVRRARLGIDLLQRAGAVFETSELGAAGLAVPQRNSVL